jgi:hypothetical protein
MWSVWWERWTKKWWLDKNTVWYTWRRKKNRIIIDIFKLI